MMQFLQLHHFRPLRQAHKSMLLIAFFLIKRQFFAGALLLFLHAATNHVLERSIYPCRADLACSAPEE
ncbi:MAG: hypothetical protein AB1584_07640 [Pseudomonadota bacterium]